MPQKKPKVILDSVIVLIIGKADIVYPDRTMEAVVEIKLPPVAIPGGADKKVRKEIHDYIRLKRSDTVSVFSKPGD